MRDWLASLGLGQYAEAFDEAAIDEEVLADLTDADLASMGLPLGHRRKLLKAIAAVTGRPSHAGSGSAAASPAAERRQLTVLFCDLVGSTALSGAMDPEALRGLMGRYHEACRVVVEKYAGQVAQYLGDGVMAYFGWPVAHEDDAERALRAGLELVAAVKRVTGAPSELQVRIGVATGPVVVGEGGEDSSAGGAGTPKLAVGETPNLAARLQGLAAPDEIVASAPTRRLAGGVFEVRDLGSHALKGVVDPVAAWQVLGLKQTEGRFEARRGAEQRLSAFVGREQEVGLLAQKWAQACGGEGQVVLLEGEPGIGKSRITQWLLEHIGAGRHYRLRYQCSPYHAQSAFHPIIEQIERAAKFSPDDAAPVRLDKLEALLGQPQVQSPQTLALLAALLGIDSAGRYPALAFAPQRQKELTLQALSAHVAALSEDAPVLLLLEDAHWIDPSTLESLTLTAETVGTKRVLVLITHRPEFKAPWLQHVRLSHLALHRLSAGQTSALARHVAGGRDLPAQIVEHIVTRTDGIPLFVEELTKAVLEAGLLELDAAANAYRLKGPLSPIAIPATLRDSLTARLDRLSPTKEMAQIGACIGREFGYGLLEKVAGIPPAQLTEALNRLTESELVFQKGSPPQASYTFKHALIQDAARDGLLRSRKAQIHARIGEVLESDFPDISAAQPEIVAHHYTEAGHARWAVPLWAKAGQLALQRASLAEAISHLTNGIALVPQVADDGERNALELPLQTALGNAYVQARGLASMEADAAFARAHELCLANPDPSDVTPVFWGRWITLELGGRSRDALAFAREMVALLSERRPDRAASLVTTTSLMDSLFWCGRLHDAAVENQRAMDLYVEGEDQDMVFTYSFDMKTVNLLYASHYLWMLGYPDRALDTKRRLDRHVAKLGIPFMGVFADTWGATVFDYVGDHESHEQQNRRGQAISREHGFSWFDHQANLWLGWTLARRGRVSDGLDLMRSGRQGFERAGSGVNFFDPYLSMIMAWNGSVDEAADRCQQAIRRDEAKGSGVFLAEGYRLLGEIQLLAPEGRHKDAESSFEASLAIAREQDAKSWELRAATSYARLMHSQGRRGEALELLRPIYDWFTEGRDTKDHIEARQLLAELESRRATH